MRLSVMFAGLALGIVLGAAPARAQRAAPRAAACRPAATGAVFTFGRTGGNIRPTATSVDAAGRVTAAGAARGAVAPDTVAALARLARDGGFWRLPVPRPRRPPRIADAARHYVAVRLSCGRRYREYAEDDAPPAFRALLDRLTSSVAPDSAAR